MPSGKTTTCFGTFPKIFNGLKKKQEVIRLLWERGQEAIDLCSETEESFIIGGGSIYKQFLPYANKFYLTLVHKDFEADTFFEVDFSDWKIIERIDVNDDRQNDFTYSFIVYERNSLQKT